VVTEIVVLAATSWGFSAHRVWFPWLIVSAVQIPGALFGSILFHSVEWYRTRRRLEALRRAAEAKIREQAALIDKAQDAILVQNLEGRFVYANPSAERLYGWTLAELQGDGAVRQLFAPGAGKLAEARRTALENGEWLGELEQVTRAGQKLVVESRWTLIRDEAGRPNSVLLINTDVTERKRLEAQFLRTQRMETIGSLAGGMAHDLNNALAPILMGIQLIGRKAQDEETRRMLTVMEANTHRGAEMVRQVLMFSSGRGGERELLNVGRLVHEMENILRQTLPKSVTIAAMVPPDLWPVVGDSTQLHQVLLNLCVNARDAMPNGGELTLAADNAELSAAEAKEIPNGAPGQYVMLVVSDTGTGIAPEDLVRIFDPFFTTKAPHKGTGLGLSTIARIVSSHGGFVSVKSELGVGTSFEVYFPRGQSAPIPRTVDAATELPRGRGELVLLIEDDRSVREMVASSLVEHGYRVVSAANGAEANSLLNQHEQEVRVVLTARTIPVTNGATMPELVRTRRPDLPIIIMSGELDSAKEHAISAAAVFLPKPFRLEQLLTAIAGQLQSKRRHE
jgi:PAS domain S-box-containing protein